MFTTRTLHTLLGVTLLLPGLVLAAAGDSERPRGHDFEPAPVPLMQDEADGWAEGRGGMPHFLRKLDLSEAQRDQLFEIRHQQAPAIHVQMKALHQARMGLRELSQADRFDHDKAKTLSRQLADASATLALLRAQSEQRVWTVLTPEQRKQVAQQRSEKSSCRMRDKPENARFGRRA